MLLHDCCRSCERVRKGLVRHTSDAFGVGGTGRVSGPAMGGMDLLKNMPRRVAPRVREDAVVEGADPREPQVAPTVATFASPPPIAGMPSILVCRGVDCAGLGSAATLVEIEELCSEARERVGGLEGLTVGTTACTLQCEKAPNCHAYGGAHGGASAISRLGLFTRVDTPAKCAAVVNAAASALHGTAAPVVRSDSSMQRRAAGMRFRAFKLLSRRCPESKKGGIGLLGDALDAEARAAPDLAAAQRAKRRRVALLSEATWDRVPLHPDKPEAPA